MGVYSKKINKILEHEPFSQLMPVVEYLSDEKMFLLEEPAIASMIICQPTSGTSEEIRNAFNTIYKSIYPVGTTIQAQLVSTPDIEDSLFGYRAVRGNRMMNSDQEQCEALADTVHDFYREGTNKEINNTGFRFRNYEFWFTIKIPIKGALPTEDEARQLGQITDTIVARLNMFAPFIANERDYYRRLRVLLNMYDKDGWRKKAQHQEKEFRTVRLGETLLEPGKTVEVHKDGISFKDQDDNECMHVKVLTMLEMPEEMFYGQMLNMVGDWQHGTEGLFDGFMISLNLIIPDQDKAKSNILRKRTFVTNQAQGVLLKFIDKLGFQKEDYDAIDREITQENAAILKYSLQMTTFSANKASSNAFAQKIMGYYSRLNIRVIQDNHFVLPFFLGNLPFGLHSLYQLYSMRFNECTSKLATFLTPHMASWKGNTAYPSLMMSSRLGQVVNLDFYDSPTNYNIYLAATSGSGKSFYTLT